MQYTVYKYMNLSWCIAHVILYAFQFVIVGTYGETAKTDIAVDAVCIMACKGEKTSRDIV